LGVEEERVSVVPCGADLPEPSETTETPTDYLLTVATLEPRKNLPRLVAAYRASGLSSQLDLVVVGRSAWGSRVPGDVTLLSGLSDQELADYYAGARAVILPSLYEGFGLPIIEALRFGTPVACSDIPVFHEVAGPHAVFFDPLSVDDIAYTLNVVANSPRDLTDWVRWGQGFTWTAAAHKLSELYREIGS